MDSRERLGILERAPGLLISDIHTTKSGREIRVCRLVNSGTAAPLAPQMVNLANKELPMGYHRLCLEEFLRPTVHATNGEDYDLTNQWKGNSFVIYSCEEDRIVAFLLGSLDFTGEKSKGFWRLLVVDSNYQKDGIGFLLAFLLLTNFVGKGIEEFHASTAATNRPVRLLLAVAGVLGCQQGDWLRFKVPQEQVIPIYEAIRKNNPALLKIAGELDIIPKGR